MTPFKRMARAHPNIHRAGGLEGGITNGQPLIRARGYEAHCHHPYTTAIGMIWLPANRLKTNTNVPIFARFPRAVVVVESMLCFVLADALLEKLAVTRWMRCARASPR
jgi:chorismate synthase